MEFNFGDTIMSQEKCVAFSTAIRSVSHIYICSNGWSNSDIIHIIVLFLFFIGNKDHAEVLFER